MTAPDRFLSPDSARPRSRRNTSARGLGTPHQQKRAGWVPAVNGGGVRCARGASCLYAELIDGVLVGGLIHAGAVATSARRIARAIVALAR
jgi:hypothetical protein